MHQLTLLHRYGQVLEVRTLRVPCAMTLMGSLAIGMISLGVLLMVQQSTGRFADAGAVAGAFTLTNGLGSPVQGRLMDRYGQTRVLAPAAVGCLIMLIALVGLAQASTPVGLLVCTAAAGGLCFPQVIAAMRTVFSRTLTGQQRESAYALLGVVFEVGVVAGPLLVTIVLLVASPTAALVAAGGITAVAGVVFALTTASRSIRGFAQASVGVGPLRYPGLRTLALMSVALGAGVSSVRVAAPAVAIDQGVAELSGVLLAVLSIGSLIGGLFYGSRTWRSSRARRLIVIQAVVAVMLLVAGAATQPVPLAILLLLTGLLLAPFVITSSSLVDDIAPQTMVTEAYAITVMANVGGGALGMAAAGAITDSVDPAGALLFGAATMACGAGLGWLKRATLASAPA